MVDPEVPELPEVSVSLPWQTALWAQIFDLVTADALPHALLLTGVDHIGKTRFARALARLLLCKAPVAGHNCGQCHACDLSRGGVHGDFQWIEPAGKGKVISVDQIRSVVEFCGKTATFGLRKVVVLVSAERMNANAANALLKSLEEPPQNTYFILVSHRPHRLPATVRSRCQQRRLAAPSQEDSLKWLDQLTGRSEDSIELLALSNGRPLLAEKIYRMPENDMLTAIPQALDHLRSGKTTVPAVRGVFEKVGLEEGLELLCGYVQQIILQEGRNDSPPARSRPIFLLLDEVVKKKAALESGANPNPQILLDALLTHFANEAGKLPA